MHCVSTVKEISQRPISQTKQVRVRKIVVRKSILHRLIPYLQVIGFIIFVCLANGIVESL